MKYRKLGDTGLVVSEIGLGTWGLSGEGYGPVNPLEAQDVINNAIEYGINFIDTADSYGRGRAEEIVGKVIKKRKDSDTIVATKFGWDFYNTGGVRSNLSSEYIRYALQQSLKRLNREWIDIYQIHVPRPDRIDACEVYDTLEDLKKRGLIRHFGVSIQYIKDGIEAIQKGYISTIQLPYSMINIEAENKLVPAASESGIGLIAREPLASGLLSGKYSEDSKFHKNDHRNGWKREFLVRNLHKVEKLKKLVRNNRSLTQTAICFVKQNRHISTVITGCKNREQLKEIVNTPDDILDKPDMDYIHELNNFYIDVSRL